MRMERSETVTDGSRLTRRPTEVHYLPYASRQASHGFLTD